MELDLESLRHVERVVVARPPEVLYSMVSDVTRMGEWSPECTGCSWEDGAGPVLGAWFTGRNQSGERVWETRCQVVAADGVFEFAWIVGGEVDGRTRWGYTCTPVAEGTEVAEFWEVLPKMIPYIEQLSEQEREDRIARFAERSHTTPVGMATTLASLKRIAEAN